MRCDSEKRAVTIFSLNIEEECSADNTHTEEKDDELAVRLQRKLEQRIQAATKKANYRPTFHVLPTSVICESLFSVGKSIMTPQRRHMNPSTFEMIIILKKNRRFFDAMTINAIIARLASDKQVAKRQRFEALLTRDTVM